METITNGLTAEIANRAKEATPKEDLKGFPIGIYPHAVQEIIKEFERGLGYPIDYTAASFLYALSIAIGNSYAVKVRTGWIEGANIWLILVGRTGSMKSHPIEKAVEPIQHRDSIYHMQYKTALKEYERVNELDKKQRETEGITEQPQKPKRKKFIISDVTPEALAMILEDNSRGVAVYRDEISGWLKDFGRYNKSGEQESWLSIWSRKPINIDRKSGASIYITRPFISVGGTIQKKVLTDLAKDGRADNGFIDRILFAFPEDSPAPYLNDNDVDPSFFAGWKNIIDRLIDAECGMDDFGNVEPFLLGYSEAAKEILFEYDKRSKDALNSTEDEMMRGICAKQDSYIHRFALILQLLYYVSGEGNNTHIGEAAIRGAIQLSEYFKYTALKAAKYITNSDPAELLPENKKVLYSLLPDGVFTTSTAIEIMERLEESHKMSRQTLTKFLKTGNLFKNHGQGKWGKVAA